MIGGKVIETVTEPERIWINVRDTTYKHDTCAIYVQRNVDSERIQIGDSIWWQGWSAFWTPATREFEDKEIRRLSYSGNYRPDGHDVFDHDTVAI